MGIGSKDWPSAAVFYPYLYPDEVVSSIHLSELYGDWRLVGGKLPVLQGAADSVIARWIEQFGVGWVLCNWEFGLHFARADSAWGVSGGEGQLFPRCHEVYVRLFPRKEALARGTAACAQYVTRRAARS